MSYLLAPIRARHVPKKDEVRLAIETLTRREWLFVLALLAVLAISTGGILSKINSRFMVAVPIHEGTFSEGVIGTPRFVNPLLAISDADRDLSALVYSGLMRKSGDGSLIPDLAESYDVSADGLTYTFSLKKNLKFHDGKPLTTDDILYTITEAKDPLLKSPRRVDWEGVSARIVDANTISFSLKQPYASFLENTTMGILPAHLWKGIQPDQFGFSDLNVKAVGSGPYKIVSVKKKSTGIPYAYELRSFGRFALGNPYIATRWFRFYNNEDELLRALSIGDVDAINSVSPEKALALSNDGYTVISHPLPRVFGLFFNQSQLPLFTDDAVIKAINLAIDRDTIIKEVLGGFGVPATGPIPEGVLGEAQISGNGAASGNGANIALAQAALEKAGWKKNASGIYEKKTKAATTTLAFSIATGDAPELKRTAEMIKDELNAAGMNVDVKIYEIGTLNQNVIRPRKYDALLFGQVVSSASDLYAFWHSSQRVDPGLNIAMYTSAVADKLLETANKTLKKEDRAALYLKFQDEVKKNARAVFLYSPDFIYVTNKELGGEDTVSVSSPSDRLLDAYKTYFETDYVWKIFQ